MPVIHGDGSTEESDDCEKGPVTACLAHMTALDTSRGPEDLMGEGSTKERVGKPKERNVLQQLLDDAALYGSYMPVVVNGIAMLWHVDSGANTTQFSPDMLPLFEGTLIQTDEGTVHGERDDREVRARRGKRRNQVV